MRKTQQDHVDEELGVVKEYDTYPVTIPGLNKLHEKSTQEIGETLALVLKSNPGIVELHYEIGKGIRVKTLRLNR
jgi:hypothetical protein